MRPLAACTWIFGDWSLAQIAKHLQRLGYDGVELMGDMQAYTPPHAREVLADHGLRVFSLTPANVDLAHPDTNVRQQAISYYLHLLDFATALGRPLVSCHGYVGRVRALSSQDEEEQLLLESVGVVAEAAEARKLHLVLEVLNRYESHLLNTAAAALAFVESLAAPNVGILLDAYHMNIEESDPAQALRLAGERLWLYHAADSNRQAIGRGHTDFAAQVAALDDIGYQGPIVIECTAPGPDPFAAIKDEASPQWVDRYLQESRDALLALQRSQLE